MHCNAMLSMRMHHGPENGLPCGNFPIHNAKRRDMGQKLPPHLLEVGIAHAHVIARL
jgi:hypothetical protein